MKGRPCRNAITENYLESHPPSVTLWPAISDHMDPPFARKTWTSPSPLEKILMIVGSRPWTSRLVPMATYTWPTSMPDRSLIISPTPRVLPIPISVESIVSKPRELSMFGLVTLSLPPTCCRLLFGTRIVGIAKPHCGYWETIRIRRTSQNSVQFFKRNPGNPPCRLYGH